MVSRWIRRVLLPDIPQETASIEGLRAILNYAVIFIHVPYMGALALDSLETGIRLYQDRSSVLAELFQIQLALGYYAVDGFLTISGFLLGCWLCRCHAEKDRPYVTLRDIVNYMCKRFTRLAPMYLIISILMYLNHKPSCIGWSELFGIASFIKPIAEYCVEPGWSVQTDLQAHLVILLIGLAFSALELGWNTLQVALWTSVIISGLYRSVLWVKLGKPNWAVFQNTVDDVNRAQKQMYAELLHIQPGSLDPDSLKYRGTGQLYRMFYFDTHMRLGPVLVGVAFGISFVKHAWLANTIWRHPVASLVYVSVVLYWIVAVATFWSDRPCDWETQSHAIFYEGFGRILFGTAVATLAVATSTSGLSELSFPVNLLRRLLSSGAMRFLGHASYGVYLGHALTLQEPGIFAIYPAITSETYNQMTLTIKAIQWYVITVLVIVPLLLLEDLVCLIRVTIQRLVKDGELQSVVPRIPSRHKIRSD